MVDKEEVQACFQSLKQAAEGDPINTPIGVLIKCKTYCEHCVFFNQGQFPDGIDCIWEHEFGIEFDNKRPCLMTSHPWLGFRYAADVVGEEE